MTLYLKNRHQLRGFHKKQNKTSRKYLKLIIIIHSQFCQQLNLFQNWLLKYKYSIISNRGFFNQYNASMIQQKSPPRIQEKVRSCSQSKQLLKKTSAKVSKTYQQDIFKLFGQIYQCQFGNLIGGLNNISLKKRQGYVQKIKNIQLDLTQLNQDLNEQKKDFIWLNEEEFKKLVINIGEKEEIDGDLDFVLQNCSKRNYKNFHEEIWMHLEQCNSKYNQVWLIKNYLQMEENKFQDEVVKCFFQIKRNVFTERDYGISSKTESKMEGKNIEEPTNQAKEEENQKSQQSSSEEPLKKALSQKKQQEGQCKNQKQKIEKTQKSVKIAKQKQKKDESNNKSETGKKSRKSKSETKTEKQTVIVKELMKIIKGKFTQQTKDIQTTNIFSNLRQLIKNSLAAKMYKKNVADTLPNDKFSFFLVINKDLSEEQFKERFKKFRMLLGFWFQLLGGILHIIGFNPKAQKQLKLEQQVQRLRQYRASVQTLQTQVKDLREIVKKNQEDFKKMQQKMKEENNKLMQQQMNQLQKMKEENKLIRQQMNQLMMQMQGNVKQKVLPEKK